MATLIVARRWPALALTALLAGILSLAACGGNDDASDVPVTVGESSEQITVGISMYLLVDDLADPNPALSSQRTEEELEFILAGMNEIWGQANVHFQMETLDTLAVDPVVLEQVAAGNIRAFFDRLGKDIPYDETGLIAGFYAKEIGGPNGITPLGSRSYMVMDEPSVHDQRVSSHEVGHILGLRHTQSDPRRLLYSGTNGMSLTPEEITLARYVAMELLKAQR